MQNGLGPAPPRSTWISFPNSHWDQPAATGIFTVEILTPRGLLRDIVLFVLELSMQSISITGMAVDANEQWVT